MTDSSDWNFCQNDALLCTAVGVHWESWRLSGVFGTAARCTVFVEHRDTSIQDYAIKSS